MHVIDSLLVSYLQRGHSPAEFLAFYCDVCCTAAYSIHLTREASGTERNTSDKSAARLKQKQPKSTKLRLNVTCRTQ